MKTYVYRYEDFANYVKEVFKEKHPDIHINSITMEHYGDHGPDIMVYAICIRFEEMDSASKFQRLFKYSIDVEKDDPNVFKTSFDHFLTIFLTKYYDHFIDLKEVLDLLNPFRSKSGSDEGFALALTFTSNIHDFKDTFTFNEGLPFNHIGEMDIDQINYDSLPN